MKIKADKMIKAMVKKAFPDYRGRKFSLRVVDAPIDCRSSWDGGSRSYFVFANLATGEVSEQVPAQSGYDKPITGLDRVELPDGFICIEHVIFQGIDCGMTLHILPSNMAKMLTETV